MSSQDRFGFEWHKYAEMDPNYEIQFLRWIKPLAPADFKDKTVLDAGCGMGRNSCWPFLYGAKHVTAFDFDHRSVAAARRNLAQFGGRAEVLFKSIYDISWQNEFDIVFSIGVIHHLENPRLAIQNLVKALKPGGRIVLWVYSHEGNEWIVKLINPVRKRVTSRLPLPVLHFLSYFVSVPLYLLVKIFKGPGAYLKQISAFKFRHIHSIVFDQLLPKIANYWKKDEALSLLKLPELEVVEIIRPDNRQGWIVTGVKKRS